MGRLYCSDARISEPSLLWLRQDFTPLSINVERLSPALEIDSLEERLLADDSSESQFRILVTTPEKLDLVLRSGWEEIARPLTLVVVDEAHNLGQSGRGIKLELLLATINRECRFAQFLLLTPFIPNAREIGRWLSPEGSAEIELGVEWQPNDRSIAPSRRKRQQAGRVWSHVKHSSIATYADSSQPSRAFRAKAFRRDIQRFEILKATRRGDGTGPYS